VKVKSRAADNDPQGIAGKPTKGVSMKAVRSSKIAALLCVMLFAASAFAANKGPLQVTNDVSVNGQHLEAGDYSVTWDGNGPDVHLNIMKGKKIVAQTAAKVVTMPQAPSGNEAVVTRHPDGSSSLKEIRFSGKKYALAISPSGQDSGSSGSSN
jgi:hypothetical protein